MDPSKRHFGISPRYESTLSQAADTIAASQSELARLRQALQDTRFQIEQTRKFIAEIRKDLEISPHLTLLPEQSTDLDCAMLGGQSVDVGRDLPHEQVAREQAVRVNY
jgi:hypothetical protein